VLDDTLGGAADEQSREGASAMRSNDDQIDVKMFCRQDDLIKRISDTKIRLDFDSLLRQLRRKCFKGFPGLLLGGIDMRLDLSTVLPSARVRRHHVVRDLEDVQKVNRRSVPGSSLCSVGDGRLGMLRKVNRHKNFIVGEVTFIGRDFRTLTVLGGSARRGRW